MNIRIFSSVRDARLELVPGGINGAGRERQVKEDAEKLAKFLGRTPCDTLNAGLVAFVRRYSPHYLQQALKDAAK